MKTAGQGGEPDDSSAPGAPADRVRAPRALIAAALAHASQAVAFVGLGIYTCVAGITGDNSDTTDALLVGALSAGVGFTLLAIAWNLAAARAAARAPGLVWQLIMIPIGVSTVDDVPVAGWAALATAALAIGGLFAPSSNAALEE